MIAGVMAPPTAVASFLTAGVGYLSSKLAGDTNAEAAQNSIQAGYVGRAITPNFNVFSTGAKEILTETGLLSGLSYAGETTKRSIEKGVFTSPGLKEFADDNKYVPLFGAFSGALRTVSSKSEFQRKTIEDARKAFGSFIDSDMLTLGMIDPQNYANIEAKIAATNPRQKQEQTTNY